MHFGRFGSVYERYWHLDPFNAESRGDRTRMRVYNLCLLAEAALRTPGDLFMAGVSWGVAQRVLYDYLDIGHTGRVLHMVDPFLRIDNAQTQNKLEKYNGDIDFVRRQYPTDARIEIHRALIPACLPLSNAGPFALAYFNTSDHHSEAVSLSIF